MHRSRRSERQEYWDSDADDDMYIPERRSSREERFRDRYPDEEAYSSRGAREERHRRDRDLDDDARGIGDDMYSSRGGREERGRFRDREAASDRRRASPRGSRDFLADGDGDRDLSDKRQKSPRGSRDFLGDAYWSRAAPEAAEEEEHVPRGRRKRAAPEAAEEEEQMPRGRRKEQARGDGVEQSEFDDDNEPPRKQQRSTGFSAANTPIVLNYVDPKKEPRKDLPSLDQLLNTPGAMIRFPDEELDGPDTSQGDQPKTLTKLCMYWSATQCKRGRDCWFAHGPEELARGYRIHDDVGVMPKSTRLDFEKIDTGARNASSTMKVPKEQVQDLMTDNAKRILMEVAGPSEVNWDPIGCTVTFLGTQQQTEKAAQIIKRVTTHCHWGVNRPKVEGLLKPRSDFTTARLTLSPMDPVLRIFSVTLNTKSLQLTIGSAVENKLIVKGHGISRRHALIEFDQSKGAVYAMDLSTNGTILNGKRLPERGSAKVILWHGDELLLADQNTSGISEFGYVVNLQLS